MASADRSTLSLMITCVRTREARLELAAGRLPTGGAMRFFGFRAPHTQPLSRAPAADVAQRRPPGAMNRVTASGNSLECPLRPIDVNL